MLTFVPDLTFYPAPDVKLNFQKSMAHSQSTLPIVGAIAIALWFILPAVQTPDTFSTIDYGLWQHLPTFLQDGVWSLCLSAFCATLSVYIMAELNNTHNLLRVSSRMLGSMLAFLLAWAVPVHQFQPGCIVMLASLLAFFPLFSTYQMPSPIFSFSTHLILSLASLVFPHLLWLIPVYWLIQKYFRSLSLRCFAASLLAIMLPYWFYGGIALLTDHTRDYLSHLSAIISFHGYDYTQLSLNDLLIFAYMILLFLSGAFDFFLHQYKDKTRTRLIYNAIILHGICLLLFIGFQPTFFYTLLALLMVDTAIVFGHFFTLTHTKFSHIYCLILLLLGIVVLVLQYLDHLQPTVSFLTDNIF